MKLPEIKQCKCCKMRKFDNEKSRLCCEPLFVDYFNTTCEERRMKHPEQCVEIFDRTENAGIYTKEYTGIPITIMQTHETAKASVVVMTEKEIEYAGFVVDVTGRMDYEETLMVQIGEMEFPFKITHIEISNNAFPIRFEITMEQVGTFSTGKWEKILRGISNEKQNLLSLCMVKD